LFVGKGAAAGAGEGGNDVFGVGLPRKWPGRDGAGAPPEDLGLGPKGDPARIPSFGVLRPGLARLTTDIW
jgi:hypothetical protein